MRQNPHVRICGGPGSATTLVYPTARHARSITLVAVLVAFAPNLASVQLRRESSSGHSDGDDKARIGDSRKWIFTHSPRW